MNTLEQNKKAASTSTIKNSEFDRLNTIHTQNSNPSNQGIHLLPPDIENNKKVNSLTDSLLKIFGGLISIFLFFTIPPLFEDILNKQFYDSLNFLFISLLACSFVGILFYYLISFWLVHKRKG